MPISTVTATVVLPRTDPHAAGLFTDGEYAQMRAFFTTRPHLHPTPVRELPALARHLDIGHLQAKDESGRFGLNAFKLLGARFTIESLLESGELRRGATLVCASEGNHGRAVARAARDAGLAARVYMAHDASPSRVDAIASEGAVVIKVDGSYDDAVRLLDAEADANGWTIISDTAWPGYERVPRLIMLGYTRMMDETYGPSTRSGPDPDIVFVQGGVGGLLCGVASWWAHHRPFDTHTTRRPRIVCVEPLSAACLQASAAAGRPTPVAGRLDTAMAGLRNREVSPLAFTAVLPIVDAYLAIDDKWMLEAMRLLKRPRDDDPSIAAGPSGSATLGGLIALSRDERLGDARRALGLSATSRVFVIVSEGVTDPELWRAI